MDSQPATRSSWKTLPDPSVMLPLGFEGLFADAEADVLMAGLLPSDMDDKWFVFHEDGWLRFVRSWTGLPVYAIRLTGSAAGVRVIDSWMNGDIVPKQRVDIAYHRALLRFIIDSLMLGKPGVFPLRPGASTVPPGVIQHSLVGRGYPEQEMGHEPGAALDPGGQPAIVWCKRCKSSFQIPAVSGADRDRIVRFARTAQPLLAAQLFCQFGGATITDANATVLHITRRVGVCNRCGGTLAGGERSECPTCTALNLDW